MRVYLGPRAVTQIEGLMKVLGGSLPSSHCNRINAINDLTEKLIIHLLHHFCRGCFLFEAPPPYEEVDKVATTQSGERRRMVSIKMPDLPVVSLFIQKCLQANSTTVFF